MTKPWLVIAAAVLGISFGSLTAAAQNSQAAGSGDGTSQQTHWYSPARYNPVKLVRRSSNSASQQLANDSDEDKKLTSQLQTHRFLPPRTDLKDACSGFKRVDECIAALHASRNLGLKFNCLRWELTGLQPAGDSKACSAPPSGKPMTLAKAIHFLKPEANAKVEANTALRQARDDISDARS